MKLGSMTGVIAAPRISAAGLKADILRLSREVRKVPCVDGSELARRIFTSQGLVGAAMCSAC
jgi:hypothetical protein